MSTITEPVLRAWCEEARAAERLRHANDELAYVEAQLAVARASRVEATEAWSFAVDQLVAVADSAQGSEPMRFATRFRRFAEGQFADIVHRAYGRIQVRLYVEQLTGFDSGELLLSDEQILRELFAWSDDLCYIVKVEPRDRNRALTFPRLSTVLRCRNPGYNLDFLQRDEAAWIEDWEDG